MRSPQDTLNDAGTFLPSYDKRRTYVTCPRCSATRQVRHQKLRCLGVTIEGDRTNWGCNHCGWTGPEAGTGTSGPIGGGSEPVSYRYGNLRKVRNPRNSPPKYWWQHLNGGWQSGTNAVDTSALLYRIDEAKEAMAAGEPILIVEGEKDVDTCWGLGFAATCNAHGAGKWTREHSEQLRGADLVVLNDNDKPGRDHAVDVCVASANTARSLRKLALIDDWPAMPEGGDITDWMNQGGTANELLELINNAPMWITPDVKPAPSTGLPPPQSYAELKGFTYMPLQWIVPDYIPEGVTLLAGKPKIGKSWLALAITMACARGEVVLDQLCSRRNVLYCALEDTPRRMQARTEKYLSGEPDWPANAFAIYELPPMDKGGMERLQHYIDADPSLGVIIIDTLVRIRGPRNKNEDQYAADHRTMSALLDLSHKTGVAIIVIHHVRKQDAGDIFDTISGTLGLNGGADTLVVLTRGKDEQLRLAVRGRDLEDQDKNVLFDIEMGSWAVCGDYEDEEAAVTGTKALIVSALTMAGSAGMSPADIAKKTGLPDANVRQMLHRMTRGGQAKRTQYGTYTV